MAGEEKMVSAWPLPWTEDPEDAPFWQATRGAELRIQACEGCGRLRHPPRPMCPYCHSVKRSWKLVSGRGTIWSFVIPHPPLLPTFQELAPYNVIVVALEEDPGIRLVGNLVPGADQPINAIDPHSVRVGEPVRVVFKQMADDVTFPLWVRAA